MSFRLASVFVISIFISLGPINTDARAQEVLRIAAIVNDEMISVFDLNARLSIVMAFAQIPDQPNTRRRLAPRVLRALIEDKLKSQEARRLEISVSETEIARALKRLESQNDVESGGLDAFLARKQVPKAALIEQVETDISWSRLVNTRFGGRIQISEEEVDGILAEVERNKGKPENLLSEIFLPVESQTEASEVANLADRLLEQLKSGARFNALARNFSKSPTAAIGGDLGWTRDGQLPKELISAIKVMQPGDISKTLRTQNGYYILYLRKRRISTGIVDGDTTPEIVNLYQVHLPAAKGASEDIVGGQFQVALKIRTSAKSCADMEGFGNQTKSPLSGHLKKLKASDLSPKMRSLIQGLPINQASEPTRTEDGVVVLMVCEREGGGTRVFDTSEKRERMRRRLFDQRLNQAARRYMRDLYRAAFVDVRL